MTTIHLGLSGPVDGTAARDATNYALVLAGADRTFGTSDDVTLAVTSAYVDGASQIDLTTTAPLGAGLYRLTVKSGAVTGLHDGAGNPLDQNRDGLGEDYVATLEVDTMAPVVSSVAPGSALSFDGNDYVMSVARNWGFSTTATVGAWIKPTTGGTVFAMNWGDAYDELLLYVSTTGQLQFYNHYRPGNYTGLTTAAGAVTMGAWTYVAGVIDGSRNQLHLYINGLEVAGSSLTAGSQVDVVDSVPRVAAIGQRPGHWTASEAYGGQMADVRLWNRALGATDLRTAMNQAASPSDVGLVLNWRLDEGFGQVVQDRSGHGNTGYCALSPYEYNWPTWTGPSSDAAKDCLRVVFSDVGGMDAASVTNIAKLPIVRQRWGRDVRRRQ